MKKAINGLNSLSHLFLTCILFLTSTYIAFIHIHIDKTIHAKIKVYIIIIIYSILTFCKKSHIQVKNQFKKKKKTIYPIRCMETILVNNKLQNKNTRQKNIVQT